MSDGKEQGIDAVNKLIQMLLQEKRIEDLTKCVNDKEYQNQLMKEYGIEE